MQGKVVFEGKSDKGTSVVIRYPTKDDARAMWEYINTLSKERTFIRFQGEQVSLSHETKFLNKQLKRIAKKESVQLHVLSGDKIIGISEIDMKDKVEKHVGLLGISIAKEYRDEGIGSLLMKLIINEAVQNIGQLRIITLEVFSNNLRARDMYKKFGFLEYGSLPNGVKLGDKFVDKIYMYKEIVR